MRGKNVAWVVFGLAFVAFAIALAATYPALPQRVASHFDAQGLPNGWMPRRSYAFFMAAAALGLPWLLIAATRLVRTLPISMVNVPHRQYWLAPERREEVYHTTEVAGIWLATSEVLLFLLVHLSVVRANHSDPVVLFMPVVWGGLAAFLLAIVVGLIAYYNRFQRRPGDVSRKNRRR